MTTITTNDENINLGKSDAVFYPITARYRDTRFRGGTQPTIQYKPPANFTVTCETLFVTLYQLSSQLATELGALRNENGAREKPCLKLILTL